MNQWNALIQTSISSSTGTVPTSVTPRCRPHILKFQSSLFGCLTSVPLPSATSMPATAFNLAEDKPTGAEEDV